MQIRLLHNGLKDALRESRTQNTKQENNLTEKAEQRESEAVLNSKLSILPYLNIKNIH